VRHNNIVNASTCNQQCMDLRLKFITQDLSCQAEADTHVNSVMSTHCTLIQLQHMMHSAGEMAVYVNS